MDTFLSWRPTRRQLGWAGVIATLAFLIIVICGYHFGWKWTGLVADANYPNRTLWDWLDLLIVPVVLALGGYLFNSSQNRATQATAERRAQDEALQAYLDKMSDMLVRKEDQPSLYDKPPPDSLIHVARARTLTVLPRLDGHRKARVVQFLREANLIWKDAPVLSLSGADLSGISLSSADLMEPDLRRAVLGTYVGLSKHQTDQVMADIRSRTRLDALSGVNLSGANLSGAYLDETDLSRTNLIMADLSKAVLYQTNLSQAIMIRSVLSEARLYIDIPGLMPPSYTDGADLSKADLSGSDLSHLRLLRANSSEANLAETTLNEADLREANLRGANLREATGWTEQQLAAAKTLKGATMPDGQKYEEWLKSKNRREDEENPRSA